ncbi:MAG TPA: hypothetical protein VKD72_16165 [Gemmataceae bacterium]|nr:hypothetical protein [Gemmataceae bacterium]
MLALVLFALYDVPAPVGADTSRAVWLADLDPAKGRAKRKGERG